MCTICQNFINYWDNEIRAWFAYRGAPTSGFQKWQQVVKSIEPMLMPEPYWGNPENCSVVMINYNPACSNPVNPNDPCHFNQCNNPLTMAGAMWRQYSDIALTFPWLDPYYTGFCANPQHLGTAVWMRRHAAWAYRVCNITTPLETQPRPFFFDLCGWHSPSWRGKVNNIGQNTINQLKDFVPAAIAHSDKKLGLCIGSDFKEILLLLGYEDITNAIMHVDEWKPKDVERRYKCYRHPNGTRIICTWASGSNDCPSADFENDEHDLVIKLEKYEQELESML
jgi:hypothetical protein